MTIITRESAQLADSSRELEGVDERIRFIARETFDEQDTDVLV